LKSDTSSYRNTCHAVLISLFLRLLRYIFFIFLGPGSACERFFSLTLANKSTEVPDFAVSISDSIQDSEEEMGSRSIDNLSLVDEIRCTHSGPFLYDLGHPLLNRVADSFVKAAGIGALQSVSREAYFTVAGSVDSNSVPPPELSSIRKQRFPGLKGETNKESLEAMVKSVGKESIQWGRVASVDSSLHVWRLLNLLQGAVELGLAAGVYSGLTYGLKEARGAHDWVDLTFYDSLRNILMF
uniref:Uncharacterized protein n=1 Tax=Cucumis melo TaxID=3656 RepID=A0A9I9DPN2_CUCME